MGCYHAITLEHLGIFDDLAGNHPLSQKLGLRLVLLSPLSF